MNEIRFDWRTMAQMSAPEFHRIVMVREAVFVVEQACAYQETDALDANARHLSLLIDDTLAGYLRLLTTREPAIGRVLIARAYRGRGLARLLMQEGLREAERCAGQAPVHVSAQAHLRAFYESVGFEVASDIYLEDGIPHCAMVRPATAPVLPGGDGA